MKEENRKEIEIIKSIFDKIERISDGKEKDINFLLKS